MTQAIVEDDEARDDMKGSGKREVHVSPRGQQETVKVTAKLVGGVIEWGYSSRLKKKDHHDGKDKLFFNKDTDHLPKKDYYLVRFDLDDTTGWDLEFAPNAMTAFWVKMGSPGGGVPPCPQTPSYSDEVFAVSVEPKRLTICNYDDSKAEFRFSLGFLKGDKDPRDPANYVRFDPIGSNQNGGSL